MAYRRRRRSYSSRNSYRPRRSSRRRSYSSAPRKRRGRYYGGGRSLQRLRIEIASPQQAPPMTPEGLLSLFGKVPKVPRVAKF